MLAEAAAVGTAALRLPADEAVILCDINGAGQEWGRQLVELHPGLLGAVGLSCPVDAGDRARDVAGE